MNCKSPNPSDCSLLRALLLLGFLEFSIAAFLILRVDPDPKNAILLGYSLSRLVFFLLALVPAGWLLALAGLKLYRERVVRRLEIIFQAQPLSWELVIFLLALLALLIFVAPFEMLGKFGIYFERVRPLLFVLTFFPAQLSLNWLIKRDWHSDQAFLRSVVVSLGVLLALAVFILFSGLGITPEQEHWNISGNPLTGLQLIVIFFVASLIFGMLSLIKRGVFVQNGRYLDLLLIFALFVATVLLWQEAPAPHNQFSTRPAAPYFQSFPASDARVHDIGGLAALNGAGILFRTYTDKPLYMALLAILHIFVGYDYNLLTLIHTCFLALMVPFLFVLGKSFHSRLFGFVLAGIVLARQQNAILLSNVFNFNATPTQLLTEVPTLFGLILASCAIFYWIKASENRFWRAFITGGTLGAVSLIRLNPFLLILATPVFLFLELRNHKKDWLLESVFFVVGSVILIAPWVITGTDQSGQSFFVSKFRDIINVRYGPSSGALPAEATHAYSLEKPTNTDYFSPLSAGLSLPPIDIHKFPGFVINHTLHNFVGSFLTLPDSLLPDDQKLAVLVERPYWSQGNEQLVPIQIPFILLNLCFLAIGLAWSWKRWKWAGLSPLFVFSIYSLSLGFGRTSGSRYLVPIDWVVDFYFALGLFSLFTLLPKHFRQVLEAEPEDELASQAAPQKLSWMLTGATILILCIATLVPAAQKLIPPQKALCQSVNSNVLTSALASNDALKSGSLVFGDVLYPEISQGNLRFSLLTCQQAVSFEIADFHGSLYVGQHIIAGLSGDTQHPNLQLIVIPPDGAEPAKILWQGESK